LARGEILSQIVEWQSPSFREIFGVAFAMWIGVFVWAVARGRNGVSRRDLIVTLPFLFLALWALRNIAVAPLVGLPVVSRALARDPRPLEFRRSFLALTSALIVLVGAFVGVGAAAEPDFRLGSYPVGAMRYLERHDLLGRHLLLDDTDAGYAILAYSHAQRVFIDDRYDMYPSSVIDDYFDLAAAHPSWSRILDRRRVEVVVWERDDSLAALLDASPAWARVHRDSSRAVWVRQA
jgi:PAS domain-containing protein